ncbi:thiaminase (transcriptional activator TenA) [Geodermatophilus saharensis]|uniref:Thiaminase (Transcriptional activator TenA) n=1 Tax=Geodermatophilus saharensis TaxID=1137994 RepID=A0A239H684_9ACTN|nr:TenA family protein [Geodermatophilus saharensis]SNS76907.1 thiaminase (transcriptional activator TenA) [Geodermatophilus saharensis]
MTLSAELWAGSADLAAAAVGHPFVTGIGDGTLPRERFAGYVAQDAFFLEAFARAYALGVAHSRDRATLDAFADLLAGVRDELRLHDGYAARWGVDLAAVEPAPATLAYTEFLLATAALGDLGEVAAAMTPCMRLYAHLGQALAGPATGPYREWVDTYADAGFEELAATLEALLDRLAADTPAVRRAYRRAMELELGFFDAAWDPGAAPRGRGTVAAE